MNNKSINWNACHSYQDHKWFGCVVCVIMSHYNRWNKRRYHRHTPKNKKLIDNFLIQHKQHKPASFTTMIYFDRYACHWWELSVLASVTYLEDYSWRSSQVDNQTYFDATQA